MDEAPRIVTTSNSSGSNSNGTNSNGNNNSNGKHFNKNTDAKGRVTLGTRFANRTVIIREVSDTELLVQLARVIPENELGLRAARRAAGSPTA